MLSSLLLQSYFARPYELKEIPLRFSIQSVASLQPITVLVLIILKGLSSTITSSVRLPPSVVYFKANLKYFNDKHRLICGTIIHGSNNQVRSQKSLEASTSQKRGNRLLSRRWISLESSDPRPHQLLIIYSS